MKKLISIMLALVFVFSMATVAFAAEGDGTTYTDASTVTITKVYKATNDKTTSPAETFTLEQVGTGIVKNGEADSAPALGQITGAYFAEGAATVDGATANITINLPEYTNVGIYEYTLKEVAGSTAGVNYRAEADTIKLVVTVINDENGTIRIAGVHTEAANQQKSGSFENTYSAGVLSVSKTVTGNLGDKTKYFEFKVTLTAEDGKTYADSYSVSGGSYESNPSTITVGEETTFYLKHDETIHIANLPYGVTYTVTETAVEGYTTEKSGNSGTINSAQQTAAFTNDKDGGAVDTGISLDSVPFILILAVCAGAAILFVTKRRSVEF